ncbi:MAG: sigma-70 family RNA polymerase sigma factor [Pirellulales bacterium]|nr:sigma-70 family RNA polymerase sigma factor [Pirellulales bacterium]
MDVAQLVQEHHGGVYRYAYRLTGSVADAEDLTQQVFLTAQQKLVQLRKAESAQSWLFAILRNCFLKGRQKRRPVPAGDLNFDVERIPAEISEDEEIDPEQLQEAIRDLPEAYRLVLVMFYYEDRSYREIAEQLDLPIGTVMSRLARAKAHLRSRLFEPEGHGAASHLPHSAKRRG